MRISHSKPSKQFAYLVRMLSTKLGVYIPFPAQRPLAHYFDARLRSQGETVLTKRFTEIAWTVKQIHKWHSRALF